MRVDFYQLSSSPAEDALPAIARATLAAGQRLLVVSGDEPQLARISEAMWTRLRETFLAHDRAGGEHDASQPILLSDRADPANGARFIAMADGLWREAAFGFERAFLMFDAATLQGARDCWRMLGQREGGERHFWKQVDGRWIEGP